MVQIHEYVEGFGTDVICEAVPYETKDLPEASKLIWKAS
jgi:hypothetical protein